MEYVSFIEQHFSFLCEIQVLTRSRPAPSCYSVYDDGQMYVIDTYRKSNLKTNSEKPFAECLSELDSPLNDATFLKGAYQLYLVFI